MYKGKGLFNLSEAQLIDSFQDFLTNLDTLTYGSYFCELIDISTEEKESNIGLFQELVKSLFLMKNKVLDIEILARAFEVKVLKYTGYALNFNHCVECGRKIETSNYISLQSLGGICNYCNKINGIGVTYATYNILKYIHESPLEELYRLSLDKETKKDIYKILNTIINQNYLKKPKSLQILNYIKEE